jgi:hypothetical protein
MGKVIVDRCPDQFFGVFVRPLVQVNAQFDRSVMGEFLRSRHTAKNSSPMISKMLLGREAGTWAAIVRESLTIAGWVAMWRPMQIYLYDWWPLLRRSRTYAKLSQMPVELVQKGKS